MIDRLKDGWVVLDNAAIGLLCFRRSVHASIVLLCMHVMSRMGPDPTRREIVYSTGAASHGTG